MDNKESNNRKETTSERFTALSRDPNLLITVEQLAAKLSSDKSDNFRNSLMYKLFFFGRLRVEDMTELKMEDIESVEIKEGSVPMLLYKVTTGKKKDKHIYIFAKNIKYELEAYIKKRKLIDCSHDYLFLKVGRGGKWSKQRATSPSIYALSKRFLSHETLTKVVELEDSPLFVFQYAYLLSLAMSGVCINVPLNLFGENGVKDRLKIVEVYYWAMGVKKTRKPHVGMGSLS